MIEIRNVSFHIGARPILNDVSLNIPEGGITALIGPNGAGKSTLLSFMARLRPLESGSIAYGGRNLADMHTAEAAKVLSILTQENSIHSRISVRDLLLFGRYPYHQGRPAAADFAIVEEAIGQFHLQDLSGRYLTELSGGQRQRLSIARAIAVEPNVYIFDDSFSALDFKTDAKLRSALAKETKHKTVLIVGQRINTIMNADKIIVLDEGKIVGQGTHQELMKNCEVYQEIAASQLSEDDLQKMSATTAKGAA